MIPVAADMACMCLLKATAKEVLRLYPVIPVKAKGQFQKKTSRSEATSFLKIL